MRGLFARVGALAHGEPATRWPGSIVIVRSLQEAGTPSRPRYLWHGLASAGARAAAEGPAPGLCGIHNELVGAISSRSKRWATGPGWGSWADRLWDGAVSTFRGSMRVVFFQGCCRRAGQLAGDAAEKLISSTPAWVAADSVAGIEVRL